MKNKLSVLIELIHLSNTLDDIMHIKIADKIDLIAKKYKSLQYLDNDYIPIGQRGEEYGGNAEQENEVTEEINEELEAREMEGYTPGQDNLIIDKNDNPGDKWG